LIPEETESARGPVYMTPVRDLYALDMGDGERVEVRRHGPSLTVLIHTPPGGAEPAEFDLRRWHYRQWAAQIEDREYSEGLRCLIATHGLFEHPEWITEDRPAELDPESLAVVDDLRATWLSRYGSPQKAPSVGAQVCGMCMAAEPPKGPLTVWSPSPTQQVCPHRDAAARALLALTEHYDELVFELLDLLVVAVSAGSSSAPALRRFVLPSEWMRAMLGHWLLGRNYVHSEHPWRSRSAARHRRFSHRALRAEGHGELTPEERYSALAWGISHDDLSLMPEEPEYIAAPDISWWTETAAPSPAGVRVYPEGASPKPAPVVERTRALPKAERGTSVRPASVPAAPAPPARPSSKKPPPPAKPKRKAAAAPRAKSADLEETLSSLTAGLAALSQIMGGPKSGRR
jgi:hypothetical protein